MGVFIESVSALLQRIIPFRFLCEADKQRLQPELRRVRFSSGDQIIVQGDAGDRTVYLLEQGAVEVVDPSAGSRRTQIIEAGYYFGEWEPLFDEPRVYAVRALSDCVCYRMSGDTLLWLLERSRAFAQAFGTILRDKQGVFAGFDRFKLELIRGANNGYINISRLVPLYRRLQPALHNGAGSSAELDFHALAYAVRRLPANVTHTFAYLLIDEIPHVYDPPAAFFPMIGTLARRRDVWEMLPGKSLVLIRSGLSDLIDLVSCLCLYACEARKIRRRLQDRELALALQRFLSHGEKDAPREQEFLRSLPFSAEEVRGLRTVWPKCTVRRVNEILRHREMFTIDVRRRKKTYNQQRTELWTTQLGAAAQQLVGHDPSDLPSGVEVHVVSSNTHSVTNCLNPYFVAHRSEVLDWAATGRHNLLAQQWTHREDLVYAIAREYFAADPEQLRIARETERRHGILRIEETVSTGIEVQLIDSAQLVGAAIDPGIPPIAREPRKLIVNIDYAFGEQAGYIIRNLLMLFGSNLRSISLLGKAGALLGDRGDVLVPTAFIQQSSDQFHPLPVPLDNSLERLRHRMPDRRLHLGPLLTVDGTLLQNRQMLQFYRHIWGCIGLEMEGAHYYRQILESSQIGVVARPLLLQFYYYVSDLPGRGEARLSERLRLAEGVPPLYAITREVLSGVLQLRHGTPQVANASNSS